MSDGKENHGQKPIIGWDEASIDDKGRVLVGKKMRERLGKDFVMAIGSVGCLVAYPLLAWNDLINQIRSTPSLNQGREQYSRLFIGTAVDDLNFDAQGRVVIPQRLREAARLMGKVVLLGCVDYLEIWSEDEFEKYNQDKEGYGKKRREMLERAQAKMMGLTTKS